MKRIFFSRWAIIAPGQAKLDWDRSRPRIRSSAHAPGARGYLLPSWCTYSLADGLICKNILIKLITTIKIIKMIQILIR